jgi:hypothetical protein
MKNNLKGSYAVLELFFHTESILWGTSAMRRVFQYVVILGPLEPYHHATEKVSSPLFVFTLALGFVHYV